jgi:myo-inositol-1-phosphate synthase
MSKIKIAIVGVGNCASSLIQGIEYYKTKKHGTAGLTYYSLGGYEPQDIEVVAAFDVDKRKVDKDITKAIFEKPNCGRIFCKDIPAYNVKVKMGRVLDGVSNHIKKYPADKTFLISDKQPCNVVSVLKESKADMLLNYLPVGSKEATKFYAHCCLNSNTAFINNIPVFIASDPRWAKKFKNKGLPLIGDDIKSQLGATILHRTLVKLFTERGIKVDRTYQLNIGGNTDFLNMLDLERLKLKKISKIESVQSQLSTPLEDENIHIGPTDYIPWLKDNKICFISLKCRGFGNLPIELDLKLSVEDSPNSAGVVIDVIRCCKLALDRKIGGILTSVSAYAMKRPPVQYSDSEAKKMLGNFIAFKDDK